MRIDRFDIHQRFSTEIVSAIENGAGEWRMPWHHDGSSILPKNIASDKGYRGINVLAFWIAARRTGHTSGVWGTYQQWAPAGCHVRKDEKATTVVFWKQMRRNDSGNAESDGADQSDGDERRPWTRFVARGYCVFNASQVDGHPPHDMPHLPEAERIARADALFVALDIPIVTGGDQPCYHPGIDTVFMPPYERFLDAASYYSCLGHETGHATGTKHRLDRDLTGRFGSAKYAMDEVIVELTSSFVMADLGIANHPRSEHEAYFASCFELLKSDPRAIFIAASTAQAAADWMNAQQPFANLAL
jgi:antirestriction protein ArdC